MKTKFFVIVITLSLLFSGMLTAVGGVATAEEDSVTEEKELEKNVEITEDNWEFFEVEITDYDEEVELGEEVNIEYRVKNTGGAEGTQDVVLSVEGEEIDRQEVNRDRDLTLLPEEEYTNEVVYDTGDVDISTAQIELSTELSLLLDSNNDSHSGKITITEPILDVPGFTAMLLALGLVTAVAIYRFKKR